MDLFYLLDLENKNQKTVSSLRSFYLGFLKISGDKIHCSGLDTDKKKKPKEKNKKIKKLNDMNQSPPFYKFFFSNAMETKIRT